MVDREDWLQKAVSPTGLTRLLLGFLATLIPAVWTSVLFDRPHEVRQALVAIIDLVPKSVAGLLLITGWLLSAILFLSFCLTKRELRLIKQEPRWIPGFNARWKYFPYEKKFEQHPSCICCEPPKPLRIWNKDKTSGVETLTCPIHANDPGVVHFQLFSSEGNPISIRDAANRLRNQSQN